MRKADATTEDQFRAPNFQRWLWEDDGVTGVGPGSSVVVTGAYEDPSVIEALWQLRARSAPDDVVERARTLDAEFNRILDMVSPLYNARRPSARLARIFAVLRSKDVLCLVDGNRTRHFRQWLEQPSYKLGFIGQQVVSRQALREVLGIERNLEDNVLYSVFSWFVWAQILSPSDAEATAVSSTIGESRATDTPRISILPAKAQRKGIPYLSNNLDLLLSIVRAAENGTDRESLDQQIADEARTLSRGSRGNLLSQASSLGLLTFENGTYRTTDTGRALLEGEPPSEVLAPVMIRTVFGIAQILDDLARQGTLERGNIAQACRRYYPRWTTDFAPNQLVAWMRDLGLVEIEGAGIVAKVKITESGEYWRSGLPSDIKVPELLLSDLQPDEKSAQEEIEASIAFAPRFETPKLEKIIAQFRENEQLKSLIFSDAQIGLMHAALHSAEGKHFVLLAGLSGTGKTSMAQGYARAYCETISLPHPSHYQQIAVWPDWTDPTGLLGFVNPLANPPAFQETYALRHLLAASDNPDKPYFLCLDEMNLARVEHYFAPFLSAMEGREGRLTIHSGREAVDGIPPWIPWPRNLFVIGTVNMDETTHPFSDKVLDRAFTFEFWDVDLDGWRSSAIARGVSDIALAKVFPVLLALSDALKPARRHFGYRTCDEVMGFVTACPEADHAAALDAAILSKVLPKVRGDSGGALPKAITEAIAVSAKYELFRSEEKLLQMQDTLKELGAVRFWS